MVINIMFVPLARDNGHVRCLACLTGDWVHSHADISEGVDLLLQLSGLLARLHLKSAPQSDK